MNTATLVLAWGALVMLGVCSAEAWIFVWAYSRVKWRATREGKHLMGMTVVVGAMTTLTLLFQVIPLPPVVAAAISFGAFGALAYELWLRNRLLWAAQHRREADQR